MYKGTISGKYYIHPLYISKTNATAALKVDGAQYEYTGNAVKFSTDDVKAELTNAADEVKDISKAVTKVVANDPNGEVSNVKTVNVTIDPAKLLPNIVLLNGTAAQEAEFVVGSSNYYKVTPLDLSTVTAKLKREYSFAEVNKPNFSLVASDFIFTKNDTILNLKDSDIEVKGIPNVIKEASGKTYENAITIETKSTSNNMVQNGKTISSDITVRAYGLANGKFVDENGNSSQGEAYAIAAEEFAGEGVAVTKDLSKLKYFQVEEGTGRLEYGVSYTIKYENNTAAGEAKLIVEGLGVYAGSQKVYTFDINPAPIQKVTSDKTEVVYNEDYDSVEEYLKDLKLTVTADNKSTAITNDYFTLKDTDYTVKVSGSNRLNTPLKITVTGIKDGNYTGTASCEVTIVNKSFASDDITVTVTPDTYTYTGEIIKLGNIIVKDGDTVLSEGYHYEVVNTYVAQNAGTATVTVRALGHGYKAGTEATGTYTINPAKLDDVKVTVSKQTYDGNKKYEPTMQGAVTIMLGNVDVTKDFTIHYPAGKDTNVNAGKDAGSLTITPTKAAAKNYDGSSKNVTFDIEAAELKGTLTIYDEYGKAYGTKANTDGKVLNVEDFLYNGTNVTFAKEVFEQDPQATVKATANDYEIQYINNKYAGTAYIVAIAKNNFKGTTLKDAEGNVIAENVVDYKTFTIKPILFSSKNITVNNGTYASGLVVKPEVTVIGNNGKILVEGEDYQLVYDAKKAINATTSDSLTVTIEGINGFKSDSNKYTFKWGIDKFDFAHADVAVTNGTVTVKNGSVVVPSTEYTTTYNDDNTITITATSGNKNYTGTKTVTGEDTLSAPTITASVDRNMVNVALESSVDRATAYDYVLCQSAADLEEETYFKSKMSVDATTTQFQFVREGQYYVYARAAKRDDNGKKMVSDWSVAAVINVTCDTPNAPTVTKVTTSGNTVTVTYTTGARTEGVDVMLGGAVRKQLEDDAMRPVNYNSKTGLIKNVPATTKTVTFTNVAKGTYFVGVHPYITSNDGLKYFGRWSKQTGITKVVVG